MSALDLLETLPGRSPLAADAMPVALTADAVYECRRQGIQHRLITDFYGADEINTKAAPFWQAELAWFQLFDDLLWDQLPELRSSGMRPATLYGRWLKLALDPVFIRGFELSALLRSPERIDHVILHRRATTEPPLEATGLEFEGPSVYSRLLPLFCEQAGIPYTDEPLAATDVGSRSTRLPSGMRRLARQAWAGARLARTPRGSGGRLTLMILHAGYDTEPLLRASLARGHRCLLCDEGVVMDVSRRIPRTVAALAPSFERAPYQTAARAVVAENSRLWDWPNGWFGVPVSQVLRPRLAYFIECIMPEFIAVAEQSRGLYERDRVDYMVTPFMGRPAWHFGAVDAARRTDRTQRVQIEHGDIASDAPALALFNLFHFDHYFAPTEEIAEYFRRCRDQYGRQVAEVHVGSYRWRRNQQAARRRWWRRPPERFPTSRPIVVYAVTALAHDQRYLNNDFFSDPWYFNLQAKIVDALARDSRFNSVVKLFPGRAHFSGPIERYVADMGMSHVRTSRGRFVDWLPTADRVIFDLPSTGLYEAAVAGVPFLSLLYDGFAFRPGAIEEIEPWTAWFHDADDAAGAVARFLDVERPRRPDLRPAGPDILTSLEVQHDYRAATNERASNAAMT